MSKSKEAGYYETNHKCNYNKNVICLDPIKDRSCGNCGWRPAVSRKRKAKIREQWGKREE